MFIYPLTIVLILLNVMPEKFASKIVFKAVVFITILFSIPDFLGFLVSVESLKELTKIIPLAEHNLGWVLPALLTFIIVNLLRLNKTVIKL
jgi:LIVCS family branched-chain amino acid:cation transporter